MTSDAPAAVKFLCPAEGCEYETSDWKNITQHVRVRHKSALAPPTPEELKCPICGHQAPDLGRLSRHYNEEHAGQEMPYPVPRLPAALECPECKVTGVTTKFNDPRGLGRHRSAVHGVAGMSKSAQDRRAGKWTSSKGKNQCPHCKFSTKSKMKLRRHLKKKHPGEPQPQRQLMVPEPHQVLMPSRIMGQRPRMLVYCPVCRFNMAVAQATAQQDLNFCPQCGTNIQAVQSAMNVVNQLGTNHATQQH